MSVVFELCGKVLMVFSVRLPTLWVRHLVREAECGC